MADVYDEIEDWNDRQENAGYVLNEASDMIREMQMLKMNLKYQNDLKALLERMDMGVDIRGNLKDLISDLDLRIDASERGMLGMKRRIRENISF